MDLEILARASSSGNLDSLIVIVVIAFWFGIPFLFRKTFKLRKNSNTKGYVLTSQNEFEHRAIAKEILGRELRKNEVVHHINGRPSDNRIENLCVMRNRDHDRYHQWYDWIHKTYGNYPRRETQLRKLTEKFNGILLSEVINNKNRKF